MTHINIVNFNCAYEFFCISPCILVIGSRVNIYVKVNIVVLVSPNIVDCASLKIERYSVFETLKSCQYITVNEM